MSNYPAPDDKEIHPDTGGQSTPDDDTSLAGEETLTTDEEEKGMDMGTVFEEDKEQDLDDLIHSQGQLKKNEIPPPEES